jgi:hypothetical protein
MIIMGSIKYAYSSFSEEDCYINIRKTKEGKSRILTIGGCVNTLLTVAVIWDFCSTKKNTRPYNM